MTTPLKTGIAALLLMTSLTAQAQDTLSSKTKISGGFGHFSFSGEQLNLGDLNSTLSTNGLAQLSPFTFSYGGGGAFCVNNFIFGGGGNWLAGSSVQNADRSVKVKGGYGFFNFGYLLLSGRRYVLYPTLGIGGGGYSMIISRDNGAQDFEQQLNTPQGMVTADAGGWMSSLQVNYQYFLGTGHRQGFFIGLKAGYKYSPGSWKLSSNDRQLSGAPGINMNGFYATLILGGGSLTNN